MTDHSYKFSKEPAEGVYKSLQERWDSSDAALRVIFEAIYNLHERKPEKGSPDLPNWELEIEWVRLKAIEVHNERIKICTDHLKEIRKVV